MYTYISMSPFESLLLCFHCSHYICNVRMALNVVKCLMLMKLFVLYCIKILDSLMPSLACIVASMVY